MRGSHSLTRQTEDQRLLTSSPTVISGSHYDIETGNVQIIATNALHHCQSNPNGLKVPGNDSSVRSTLPSQSDGHYSNTSARPAGTPGLEGHR